MPHGWSKSVRKKWTRSKQQSLKTAEWAMRHAWNQCAKSRGRNDSPLEEKWYFHRRHHPYHPKSTTAQWIVKQQHCNHLAASSSQFQLAIIPYRKLTTQYWYLSSLLLLLSPAHSLLTFLLNLFYVRLQQHLSAPRPRSKRTDQQNEKVAGMVNDIRQSNAGQLLALRQKLKQQKLTTRRRTQFAAEAVASSSSSSTKTTTTCSEKKEEDAPPPPPVESPPSSPTTTRQQTTQRSSSNVARRCNLWNHSNCFR